MNLITIREVMAALVNALLWLRGRWGFRGSDKCREGFDSFNWDEKVSSGLKCRAYYHLVIQSHQKNT